MSKGNLIKEVKDSTSIYGSVNTAIDALKTTVREGYILKVLDWA